jgi:hypothetical protein
MYMSPEAVRGARDLTPAADQYSLGVMLYECVTGRPPFFSDSLLGVLEAVAHGQFEPPRRYRPELSSVLEIAILRAMSRDPGDRFASVRELGRALCEAADQRTRLLWTPSFGLRDLPYHRSSSANLGSSQLRTGSPLSASVSRRPRRLPIWQVGLSGLALLMLALASVAYWRMPTAPYAEMPVGVAAAARAAASSAATASAAPSAAAAPSGTLPPSNAVPVNSPASTAAASTAPAATAPAAVALPVSSVAPPPLAAVEVPSTDDQARAGRALAVQTSSLREAPPAVATPAAARIPAPRAPDHVALASPAEAKTAAPKATGGARRPADERAATRYTPPRAPEAEVAEPPDHDEVVFPVRAPTPPRPPALGANQSPILD